MKNQASNSNISSMAKSNEFLHVKWWVDAPRSHFKGFWFKQEFIEAATAIEAQFKPLPSDIILASFPKSGTTWLKALTTSILRQKSNQQPLDPLSTHSPHELIPFLEVETFGKNPVRDINALPSPRVFNTHLPYSIMPHHLKNSGCKIVYVARNPADTFVSLWHMYNQRYGTNITLEEAFDEFCDGFVPAGPYFEHIMEFWDVRGKENVYFVTYEELKKCPIEHVGKLAEFLGVRLGCDEIEQVVRDCSFERLSKLDVNNSDRGNGSYHWSGMGFGLFFRKGVLEIGRII